MKKKTINVFNIGKIDTKKYINIETGEFLSSEADLDSISFKKNTGMKILSSEEFVVIDHFALVNISDKFSNVELGRILKLSDMVRHEHNLLYNKKNKKFHTKKSLMIELDYTRNKFAEFMKKLADLSIISYVNGYENGKECEWMMFNPYLARKSKAFSSFCLERFVDLTKLEVEQESKE